MLETAVAPYRQFQVDDREIRRGGPSYMVDTLAEIRSESGHLPLVLVVGQDAASELDSWHRWRQIFELAHVAVMRRPDSDISGSQTLQDYVQQRIVPGPERLQEKEAGYVVQLEITQLAISSTDIRSKLNRGQSPRFLLPDEVLRYIHAHRLYFAGPARKG